MASTQQIKRRIKSVSSTKKITKAMELVAASKMRRAQEATLRSRAYRNTARELLTRLAKSTDVSKEPLFAERELKNRIIIVISSDRGLAGAYNSYILKAFTKELRADKKAGINTQSIFIGRQAARFGAKVEGLDVIGVYEDFPDRAAGSDIQPILDTVIDSFLKKEVDKVDILFTDYISSINQEVRVQTILPAHFEEAESPADLSDTTFEPSPEKVVRSITPRLIKTQLFQALLESQASEHSMRMMAMKSASDNASDLIDDLTLVFNSARQAAITQELAEISSGAEAIS